MLRLPPWILKWGGLESSGPINISSLDIISDELFEVQCWWENLTSDGPKPPSTSPNLHYSSPHCRSGHFACCKSPLLQDLLYGVSGFDAFAWNYSTATDHCCITLHCTALNCTELHCTTLHCTTLCCISSLLKKCI